MITAIKKNQSKPNKPKIQIVQNSVLLQEIWFIIRDNMKKMIISSIKINGEVRLYKDIKTHKWSIDNAYELSSKNLKNLLKILPKNLNQSLLIFLKNKKYPKKVKIEKKKIIKDKLKKNNLKVDLNNLKIGCSIDETKELDDYINFKNTDKSKRKDNLKLPRKERIYEVSEHSLDRFIERLPDLDELENGKNSIELLILKKHNIFSKSIRNNLEAYRDILRTTILDILKHGKNSLKPKKNGSYKIITELFEFSICGNVITTFWVR